MNKHEEVAIRYKNHQLSDDLYMLIPEELVVGYSVNPIFYSINEHVVADSKEAIEANDYLVDRIFKIVDLCEAYDYEDQEFVKSYFFEEEKSQALIIDTSAGKVRKTTISIDVLREQNIEETYRIHQDVPSLTLNEGAVSHLLSLENISEIKSQLEKYRKSISNFRDKNEQESLTKVSVKNGNITEINIDKNIVGLYNPEAPTPKVEIKTTSHAIDPKSISVSGLESYIKERVFGHPEEIRKIATILVMNLRASKEDGTESILIPGPTGTGKTATVEAASEYLGVPFKIIDTSNLVTQGIKGTSLEDELLALLSLANNNRELAEKGIVAFDEFDKLSRADLDIKGPIKDILLKFSEGSTYRIERLREIVEISTHLISKIYLGAFEELFAEDKTIGFGNAAETNHRQNFDIKRMYEKQIYSKELISRLPHVIPYYELTNEIKRDIILRSKLSKYLQKKKRYEREFGVELIAEDSYIDALIASLNEKDRSVRDLNNLILRSLSNAEYELLAQEGHVKRLVLTGDTVTDSKKFDLS